MIKAGPTIIKYADMYDIPVQEVVDWINSYIHDAENSFPQLLGLGLVEDTEEARMKSICNYVKGQTL